MSSGALLQEHWTDQNSAVVVTGEAKVIGQIVLELKLSEALPVSVSDSRLALALWGDDLSTYLEWRTSRHPNSNGSVSPIEEMAIVDSGRAPID